MTGARILIVDDSTFTGQAVAWALRKAGFDPVVARDLWDLERPDIGQPALVFMDVVLQEAFGDDLAQLLRGARGIECPIVLLSSLPDEELAQRSEEAGLDGFVSKRGGLPAVVARAIELLGQPGGASAGEPQVPALELAARQSVRRIVHIAADIKHWNVAAIVAEAHALAGDADLAGAHALASAARAVRDVVKAHGGAGPTPETGRALSALVEAAGAELKQLRGKLLVVDTSGFARETLYAGLDQAGYVLMEAQTLAEARQKIFATEYDMILVEDRAQRDDPSLVPELRGALPDVRLEIIGVMPLAKHLGPTRLVDEIRGMLQGR
jgi:DNA-binding response OmpR family regulator